jgi:hypothetical protein
VVRFEYLFGFSNEFGLDVPFTTTRDVDFDDFFSHTRLCSTAAVNQ